MSEVEKSKIAKMSLNLNANPSIETDTTGYAAIGSAISKDAVEYHKGTKSLKTITDNAAIEEGFKRTVTAESAANTEYTFSVYLKGSGTVILRFYDDVTEEQDGSVITLSETWTRYSLTKTFGAASTVRELQVVTDVKQSITFYTDALQHELGAIATEYTENKISSVVDIRSVKNISLILPIMNGAENDITFQVAEKSDGTYVDLKNVSATAVKVDAGVGGFATEPVIELKGHSWMKITTSVAQTAVRLITVMFKQ